MRPVYRRTPAAGSPPRPATAPSTGCDANRPASDRHLAAHRLHGDDMEPDHDPASRRSRRLRRRRRRRPAPAHVPLLPSRPGRRRPGRAHAAAPRRSRHARDRPRLPPPRCHARPADRPGQAQAPRQPRALPRATRAPSCPTGCTPCSPPSTSSTPKGTRPKPATALSRVDLSREAIRLGRLLVELMPDEPEAVGLLALMLLTEARQPARTAADGSMIRLADQDRTRWDRALIAEGHAPRPRLPAPQPARTVPDPSRHRRRARRRRHRRRHRLVPDRRPLRPALRAAPERRRRAQPGHRHRRAPRPRRRPRRPRPHSTTPRSTTTSPTTPRAPTSSPARANRKRRRAAYDRAIELSTNPTERRFLEQQRRACLSKERPRQARSDRQ